MIIGRICLLLIAVLLLYASFVQASNKKVVARVDGEEVTAAYLAGLKASLPKYLSIKEKDLLKFAIQRRLISLEARKMGLDRDPDVSTLLDVARDEVLAKAYWVKVGVKGLKVPPEAVRSYYDAYPEKFTQPEQIRFLWIRGEDKTALDGLKRTFLKIKGKDRELAFSREAKKAFDIFPVLVKGVVKPWDSGFVDVTKLPGEIKKAFDGAKVGDVIGPMLYKGAAYLFYIAQRHPPKKIPFEDVRQQIEVYLVREKQQEFIQKSVEQLKKKYGVEIVGK